MNPFIRKTERLIRELAEDKIFSIKFIKRSSGEERLMVCRLDVNKDIKGEGHKFEPIERGLLSVYDMQKKAYRFVNLATASEIHVAGKVLVLTDKGEWE
jgi:hypothetical protein